MIAVDGPVVQLGSGISLVAKRELHFTFTRLDNVPRGVDEWDLKEVLLSNLKRLVKFTPSDERDLKVQKEKELHRKRREDPIATGSLKLWQCGFKGPAINVDSLSSLIVTKLDQHEMRVQGVKLVCKVESLSESSLESMTADWEKSYRPSSQGHKLLSLPMKF